MKPKTTTFGAWLDDNIAAVSPVWGFKREYARWAKQNAFSRRGGTGVSGGFDAAKKTRGISNWNPGGGSPDADIVPDLDTLRDRSRDRNRNDAHASGITKTMVSNIIGSGIVPQSRIPAERLGMTEDDATIWKKNAERVFRNWSPWADSAERVDFLEMENVIVQQVLENGEAILLRRMIDEPYRPYSFAWELIESDRLATPPEYTTSGPVRAGVEIGERGQPVAYHIQKTHPGDIWGGRIRTSARGDFVRIPTRDEQGVLNVLHLYHLSRPGQTRGVPFFSPILKLFRHLDGMVEAEVVATRLAACISLLVETPDALAASANRSSGLDSRGDRIENFQYGMVKYLGAGQKVNAFNPQRPNSQFEPFVDALLKMMAASLGISYELVSKDFTKSSYSSARASLLQSYRFFRTWQNWLSRKFCQPTYAHVISEAYLRGQIPATNFYNRAEEWTAAHWITPGWEWVDPLKEASATAKSIDYNVESTIDASASRGKDWEEILEQEARVYARRKELGLPNPPRSGGTAPYGEESSSNAAAQQAFVESIIE